MRKTTSKKLTCLALSLLMALGTAAQASFVGAADAEESRGASTGSLTAVSDSLFSTISYAEYNEEHKDAPRGTSTINIKAVDYDAELTDAAVSVLSDYQGRSGKSLLLADEGTVTWKFNVPKTGRYAIKVDYCSESMKANSIERVLYINGKVPFSEARYLLLKKKWVNTYTDGRFQLDSNGNELRPTATIDHTWQEYVFIDANTYYANPFEFYLEAGENTISLEAVRENAVIQNITVYPYEDKVTYEEYISGKSEAAATEPIILQAELPSASSDYTVYPVYDRKSAITQPQHHTKIMLNTIGGEKWATPAQFVEYTFDVETAGLYSIAFRYRQDLLSGMYVSRKLYIDGEIPFEEANYLKFPYSTSWEVGYATDGADVFQFYLEPGTHTVRLEATLGEMGDTVRQVNDIMNSMNDDYMEILKLTGATPDTYRDYGFGRVLPHVVEDLVIQSINLNDIADYIESTGEVKSENSTTLRDIARRLETMGTDEDKIAAGLSGLKSDVGSLGTWISTIKKQSLELDYIMIQPISEELPRAEANFIESLLHEIKQFIGSFLTDYNSLGSDGGADLDKHIEVWVTNGRDQAQVMRNLIDNYFIPQTNIGCELKLISAGTLLPSVLSGVGPDVSIEGATPIDYAIRSAVLALNPEAYEDAPDATEEEKAYNAEMRDIFSDFSEVTKRFQPAAMIPLTLYGKTYGMPTTQSWNMMYYRLDILEDLNLEIPKTWDDLMAMVPVLQFNNMEIGLPNQYQMFLYQMGGNLWADDGMRINLDSNLSLDAFEKMCNMFTQYSLPVSYDLGTRFKTGEVPIAIGDLTAYNSIVLFSTEIAGLWGFGPIPGMVDEDGNINNVTLTSVAALTMLSGTEDPASSWEFMKWFTDTQFQVDYGNELVAVLGEAGKTASANIAAMEELPWSSKDYKQLISQMDNLIAIPAYPGSYFVDRYTGFAFNDAYNNHADPSDSLQSYIPAINKEISRKRVEFNLETLDPGQTLATKRMGQVEDAIAGMDEGLKAQYSAQLEAAQTAIDNEDIEALRSAAKAMASITDETIVQIVEWLNDAADALESYLYI